MKYFSIIFRSSLASFGNYLVVFSVYVFQFVVKCIPRYQTAIWETWVRSLGWEDPLEKGRLPTPVFRPGEFHGLYSPWGRKESDTTERLSLSTVFLRFILVVACISTSCFFFLLLDSNLPYEYITLFIHSSVGFMSLRHTPKNRIAGSYDNYAL